HGGRIVSLVSKLCPSRPEVAFGLRSGSDWAPIQAGGGIGTFGVLVCLDFLYQEQQEWQNLVAPVLGSCRWLAVPSLTSRRSILDFRAKAAEQSKRYKRPVVHANSASHGGSCVYVDPEPCDAAVPPLPSDEEAGLVVDIDVASRAPGRSTPYVARPSVKTCTRPTLVYASLETEYAQWLELWHAELSSRLNEDEGQALCALAEWLEAHPPPEAAMNSEIRRERLGRLMQDKGRWRTVGDVIRLTYEIVLSRTTVPPKQLRE